MADGNTGYLGTLLDEYKKSGGAIVPTKDKDNKDITGVPIDKLVDFMATQAGRFYDYIHTTKNDTDTITISKKDTTKIFSDTTSIVPKVVDTVAIAIEDSIKKADINKVSSTISSQSVQDFMNKYYQDICQNNFDVSTYFSSNVNQFITLKNTTSNTIDYQINIVAKKEFRNTKINITSSVEETNGYGAGYNAQAIEP